MIRPMERKDLEWVARERNRPKCRQWFRQPKELTIEDQERWWNEKVKTGEFRPFIILDEDGDRIGMTMLSHIDPIARKCEFGIMVVQEARNHGYGKKALWETLAHAFDDLNMYQVYSDVFAANPSLDTYLRWGFKEYGKLPDWYWKNGQYIDSIIISITKDEFNATRQTNNDDTGTP